MEDHNGTIWIGTMGSGLLKFEENSEDDYSFTNITTNDGLPNNTIKTIVEDNDGMLWLASNKGLSRYNPNDGGILNYDKEDGLQDNDFSEICGLKRKNGDLVFGGINGFNVFQTQQLKIDKIKPRLYFTDFLILNKEVKTGDLVDNKQILKKAIEYTKSIELEYHHNSFSIGFVGIQFNSPQKNNYRYILEGFDKEWYKASPDYRLAKYTNIPDGEYTFKVMGSNSDNIWTNEPIELKIIVKSPKFRSPLAITIYIALLIVLLIVIFKVIKEITQRRRDVLLANIEKERVEEIARLKLQFFTNISHEFRTPLSLITTPLEQLIIEGEKTNTKNQQYNLSLIRHNVGVMMRLINQLLDFRKLDQNKLRLKPSSQSLNAFLENIFLAFEVLAKQKNITYNFYPWTGGDDIWIDVDKMEKVIYNLLSNAFKYTDENGRIEVKAEADLKSNEYIISVSDTGIGIAEDEEIHIFERYYQADNKQTRNISGTGIGLALAKGFVDLHQGEIGFYPNKDEGTVFFVKLRMGNAHFSQDMFVDTQVLNSLAIPEYQSPELDAAEKGQKASTSNLPKMLVVEDNFELRKQIKNIFRNEFRVYEAEDGEAGLAMCKVKLPDIIVTDVMMPKMDGMEMCKKIKSDEEISHIPIMILTAKNTDDTIVEGYDIGADGYVMKPFNVKVLKARVNSLVKNREQLRARFQKEIEINPKIISNTPADSKFLDKILAFIEANLSEAEYSVEQLAADYGVSRIYLNRKIKALTGETTIEFMRNIKLKHAAELLKQNKLNISEVAWDVGYNDIRTFRKRFKEKFEMSPSEFARQYK
jgi:signal transduction histidine kinase/CheY-like chemotaxis protein